MRGYMSSATHRLIPWGVGGHAVHCAPHERAPLLARKSRAFARSSCALASSVARPCWRSRCSRSRSTTQLQGAAWPAAWPLWPAAGGSRSADHLAGQGRSSKARRCSTGYVVAADPRKRRGRREEGLEIV